MKWMNEWCPQYFQNYIAQVIFLYIRSSGTFFSEWTLASADSKVLPIFKWVIRTYKGSTGWHYNDSLPKLSLSFHQYHTLLNTLQSISGAEREREREIPIRHTWLQPIPYISHPVPKLRQSYFYNMKDFYRFILDLRSSLYVSKIA